MADDLDNFLEHYGVKGMKWGVRKASDSPSTTRRPSVSPKTKEQAKYIGKELAFGSIGPAALLMGAGPPISIALGISVGVLRSPPVSNAIKQSSKATADLMKEIGDTKLSAMKAAKATKQELRDSQKSAKSTMKNAREVAADAASGVDDALWMRDLMTRRLGVVD